MTTEATQPAATQQGPITVAQAANMLAEKRQAQAKPDLSAHASAMGKAAAEARKARTTEAQPAPQSEETEGETEQDDQSPTGETLSEETASSEHPETEGQTEGEPQDGTIDLGDGVKVTLDEVRDGFMLKADHTRKTQALAEERKAFESDRTQRLSLLDNVILAGQQLLGQPQDPRALIEEYGADEGMKRYFAQVQQFEQLGRVIQVRQEEQARNVSHLKQATIKELSAELGDKAEGVFSKAVEYVASKTGTDPKAVEAMMAHPEAVKMVQDAMAYRELKASEGTVKRTIAEKPKVIKPGPKVSAQSQAQNNIKTAKANLQKSGSWQDAVALLRAQRQGR